MKSKSKFENKFTFRSSCLAYHCELAQGIWACAFDLCFVYALFMLCLCFLVWS
ncbi:hypothetical protein CANARDRAFT_9905 [[Candida] arabinofermentans NRRL YB-2248]|uniref:Uncharacterized protein n=1 Tax=[Candida] arabinofermentans NRRL YB-2248 TaxID=983967 RepID=A0A1E4SUK0_9ASCO|nr:hypothetical protein CANARDRAFT_9905 [[Candida] arabinofermentans NRRL YB-2248]